MYKFMNQETAMRKALRTERKEGIQEKLVRDARGMYVEGLKPEAIARIQGISVKEVEQCALTPLQLCFTINFFLMGQSTRPLIKNTFSL